MTTGLDPDYAKVYMVDIDRNMDFSMTDRKCRKPKYADISANVREGAAMTAIVQKCAAMPANVQNVREFAAMPAIVQNEICVC